MTDQDTPADAFGPPIGELAGRVALVTGASRGIGRAIALELAGGGADVLVHARGARREAEDVADRIRALGRRSDVVLADLSDAAMLAQLADRAWDWQGGVQILVNNAGVDVLTGDAASWSFEEKLQRLLQVDLLSTVRLSRDVGARMRAAPPARYTIINIGWDQAAHGMEGDSGQIFATVKGAVMAFTASLARTLAPQVRVNCVAPGWIQTAWGTTAPAAWQQRAESESLLRRWGRPEDVARVVRFLASPAADFVAGQVLPVNGGFRMGTAFDDS